MTDGTTFERLKKIIVEQLGVEQTMSRLKRHSSKT